MGYGKPLGFGGTQWALDATRSTLMQGSEISSRYTDLGSQAPVHGGSDMSRIVESLINEFRAAAKQAWNVEEIEDAAHVQEYLAIAKGISGLAVRYPRPRPTPEAKGMNFAWFMWNEGRGPGRALGSPTDDNIGLPDMPPPP